MRRALALASIAIGLLLGAAAPGAAASASPWQVASTARDHLGAAETQLALGHPKAAAAQVEAARTALAAGLAGEPGAAPVLAAIDASLVRAAAAARAADPTGLTVARADGWTALLGYAARRAIAATAAGELETARAWLLVREFRPPTRFSRAAADATTALAALGRKELTPKQAAGRVRADLYDSYQALMRSELDAVATNGDAGLDGARAQAAAIARGYLAVIEPAYRAQHGAAAAARSTASSTSS